MVQSVVVQSVAVQSVVVQSVAVQSVVVQSVVVQSVVELAWLWCMLGAGCWRAAGASDTWMRCIGGAGRGVGFDEQYW